MTDIQTKTVRRSRFRFTNYGADAKRIVVTIEPNGSQGDFVSLRLERRRQSYQIDVADLLRHLIRQKVMHKRMEKVRSKKKSVKRFIRLTA